jgi:hypothetical protein
VRTVVVKKDLLLTKLEENRKTHNADFEIAFTRFAEQVQRNLEARLKSLRGGDAVTEEMLYINLTMPINYDADYKRAIEMLAWEVGDEVELTEQEFKQYVQDSWGWKAAVEVSNKLYTGSASPSSTMME